MTVDTRTSKARAAALALLLTLTLWFGQGLTSSKWAESRDRVSAHTASTIEVARYPLAFLYRHGFDEELYWNVSSQILGKPFDAQFLETARLRSGSFEADSKVPRTSHTPYVDVPLEYPALSLPFLLLPRLLSTSLEGYSFVFSCMMGAFAFGAFWLVIRAQGARMSASSYLLATGLSLAHGALFVQRLDAVLALFLALAAYAWAREKLTLFGVAFGLAAAFKFTPALLFLPIVVTDRRWMQSARLWAAFVGTAAVFLLPMLFFSPDAILRVLRYHGARGLQCESLWATLYGLVASTPRASSLSYGSLNVTGTWPDALAKAATPISLGVLGLLAFLSWRRQANGVRERAARHSMLDIARLLLVLCAALWLTSKVFSPQYLTWMVPLAVPLLHSKEDRLAGGLFATSLVITQIYLRGYYDAVSEMRPLGTWTLLVRDLCVAASAFLAWRNVGRTASLPTSSAAR